MSRHQTINEIALNQHEATVHAEIEKLEMQQAALECELEQDIDDFCRMQILHTLRVLTKALLMQQRELTRVKDMQIKSVQMTLRACGVD